jgi:hypothetical protein
MKPIIPLLLSLASCLSVPAAEGVIAYAETEHNSFEVFDLRRGWVSFGDRNILTAPLTATDLGGPLDRCNDQDYHCFTTGLHLAVPKTGSPRAWTVGRMECLVIDGLPISADRPVRIRCSRGNIGSVEFSFSRARGVVSYRHFCSDCYLGEFRLVGERGLFADP